jgi:hypothetical protein
MRAHEIKAKKNRHYRRLFSFGGGLNSRDRDAEDDCDDDTGRDNRGYHRPIIVTFYSEWLSILILWHGYPLPSRFPLLIAKLRLIHQEHLDQMKYSFPRNQTKPSKSLARPHLHPSSNPPQFGPARLFKQCETLRAGKLQ